MVKEGVFFSIPPILYGTNYDNWKVRLVAFNKSIDSKAQKVVVNGWVPPIIVGLDGNEVVKAGEDWDDKD